MAQLSKEALARATDRMTLRLGERWATGTLSTADYHQALSDLKHWFHAQSCCAEIWDRIRWRMHQ